MKETVAERLARKLAEMDESQFQEFSKKTRDSEMYKFVQEAGFVFTAPAERYFATGLSFEFSADSNEIEFVNIEADDQASFRIEFEELSDLSYESNYSTDEEDYYLCAA